MLNKCIFLLLALSLFAGCSHKEIPSLVQTRDDHAICDLDYIYSTIDIPCEPLTLKGIIDIAWRHNWDVLAKELEWAVQREVTTREMLRMLPSFTFNGEWSHRNKRTASRTQLIPSGIRTPPSIGSEQRVRAWDATLSFKVIDFALAYYQSQESSWRALGLYMQYARLKQNMILEIYKSYWKAMSARWGAKKSQEILALIAEYREKFDREMDARYISRVPGLRIEDQMLNFQVQLYSFEFTYQNAKAELAALMGIPADVQFELAEVEMDAFPELEPIEELEQIALRSRPELYNSDFEENISTEQVRQAVIRTFPSTEIFKSYRTNLDRFLVHHHWIVTGLRVAWDLLSVPQHIFDIKAAQLGRDRAYVARLALSVGVMTQVNIAYFDYLNISEQYKIREDIYNVRTRLADASWMEFYRGEFNMVDVILSRASAIQGGVDAISAYGQKQIALEQVNNSIGQPLRFNTLLEIYEEDDEGQQEQDDNQDCSCEEIIE
ncbi:MAG: TolC family protein [Parachlamydiaceae bacterium]|nr:TolC family protein [Parachlamydiaceae bacterium]